MSYYQSKLLSMEVTINQKLQSMRDTIKKRDAISGGYYQQV